MTSKSKFSTFGGVFTPSILTILGVIMYLRLPLVLGETGLYATLGIIAIAHFISLTTGLSVSSIATDKKVQAGGTYYMISRSLGLPIGGTLGIALFIGLSFSISLYLIGFAESFLSYWELEQSTTNIRITGSTILILVTALTFISTSLAIKTQYIIMGAIILSLISIFMGGNPGGATMALTRPEGSTVPFMLLFGIFFPAVTGFEAGVSMSGDLRDPKKSIPKGTIAAILVGLVMYIVLAVFLSYSMDTEALLQPQALVNMAYIPELVVAGIWGATLSSALGSILGAPRILQATSIDRITWGIFAKGSGNSNEPRNALLLTFALAEIGILIGELDTIARIVSVFFITTYAFLNLSCAFEAWSSADFRPQFRIPAWISLLGAFACLVVMIQLDPLAMLGAVLLLGGLLFYLKRRSFNLESGDAWSGVWASLVKSGLERLQTEALHRRNWRPNILLFSGGQENRPHLVELGQSLASNLGILSDFELVAGSKPLITRSQKNKVKEINSRYFKHRYECLDVYDGMEEISRLHGFASMEPNTVLMGWSSKESHLKSFTKLLKSFKTSDYNTCFLNHRPLHKFGEYQQVDVWWSGKGRNLALAVRMLRYMSASGKWANIKARLIIVNEEKKPSEAIYRETQAILNSYRQPMEVHVISNYIEQLPWIDLLTRESKQADLTLIGMPDQVFEDGLEEYVSSMQSLLSQLGTSMIIHASSSFESWDILGKYEGQSPTDGFLEPADLSLPPLPQLRNATLQQDLVQIDTHGQKLLEALYQQLLAAFFQSLRKAGTQTQQLGNRLFHDLEQINQNGDQYKRRKSLAKLRNESYFQVAQLLENSNLPSLGERFEDAVNWYMQELTKRTDGFPAHINISHPIQEFASQKGESWQLKRYKFSKRSIPKILSKETVEVSLPYQKIAQWYLHHQGEEFFAIYIYQCYFDSLQMIGKLKSTLGVLQSSFSILEKEALDGDCQPQDIAEQKQVLEEALSSFFKQIKTLERQYYWRLQLSFRERLSTMGVLLDSPCAQLELSNIKIPKKRSQWLAQQLPNYAQAWHKHLPLQANKIYLEWLVNGLRSRMQEELRQMRQEVKHLVQQRYIKEIQQLQQSVNDISVDQELYGLKVPDSQPILDIYEKIRQSTISLIGNLTEELKVMSDPDVELSDQVDGYLPEVEEVKIPLSRLTSHFVEVHFISPLLGMFEELIASATKGLYTAKDQGHLAKFNLGNFESNSAATVSEAVERMQEEAKMLAVAYEQFDQAAQRSLEEAFDPLTPMKIINSTQEFSQLLRGYQGKQVLSGVGRWADTLNIWTRKQLSNILYSRSKGLLLAKKLTTADAPGTNTGQLLDMVEQYTPKPEVLKKLPYYYSSLFSGRSLIDEDFWVPREEEALFKKAYQRYQQGYKGGILFLGGRNAGKSLLSKTFAEKYMPNSKIIQVFPPNAGSVNPKDFDSLLRKASGFFGTGSDVLSSLPQQSVVILHDLELWWQRSKEGDTVLNYIKSLINQYADECLFIVNTNPYAYKFMQPVLKLDELWLQTIYCQPFDASELQSLIMRRQQSSGLAISFEGKQAITTNIADWYMAKVFNTLFNLSGGNPGMAMSIWLASVEKLKSDTLYFQFPRPISSADWKSLSEDQWLWLLQFVLHKRMNASKLQAVLQWPEEQVQTMIKGLVRTGLIKERQRGIYVLNEALEYHIVRALITKEWL